MIYEWMFPLGCRDAACSVGWMISFFTTDFLSPLERGRGVLEYIY